VTVEEYCYSFIHSFIHSWHAPLGACSMKRRHQSPEWTLPLKLHLTTSELWFGQEQEEILP